MAKQNLTVPFPRNLLCDVFGEETALKELPPGIDESLEYVLENMMPERDAFILILRYMRNMKIREIAAYYGLSSGRIHQIIQKAHRRLRHPRCRRYLLDDCVSPECETPQVAEKQISLTPPADPRPEEAICNIEDAHIRIDAIMARGGLNRIEWLNLPIRAYNCLMTSQVETVWQLCLLSPAALLQIKNLGVGTLAAIQEKLCAHNLVLDDGTMEIDDQMWDYAEKRYAALAANSG